MNETVTNNYPEGTFFHETVVEELNAAKNQAYSERNKCVVAMASMAQRLGHTVGIAYHDPNDEAWDPEWRTILVIELPTGQVTWHLHDSEKELLSQFQELPDHEWDGHTTEEKYKRLLAYGYLRDELREKGKQKQPFIKFTLIDGEPLYFSLDTVIESISGHKKGDEQHTVIVTKNIQYEVQGSPEDILVALYSHPG